MLRASFLSNSLFGQWDIPMCKAEHYCSKKRSLSMVINKVFVDMPQMLRGFYLHDLTTKKAKVPLAQAKELLKSRMLHFRHYTCFYGSSGKNNTYCNNWSKKSIHEKEEIQYFSEKKHTETITPLPLSVKQGQLQLPRELLILLKKKQNQKPIKIS